jgi:hypothetical protein
MIFNWKFKDCLEQIVIEIWMVKPLLGKAQKEVMTMVEKACPALKNT